MFGPHDHHTDDTDTDAIYQTARSMGLNRSRDVLPLVAPSNPSSQWPSEFHWNGLACYREPSAFGTYATCCSIQASPLRVFQHMIHLADGSSAWTFFKNVHVVGSRPDVPQDANGLVRSRFSEITQKITTLSYPAAHPAA
jgi:hypothetical protein